MAAIFPQDGDRDSGDNFSLWLARLNITNYIHEGLEFATNYSTNTFNLEAGYAFIEYGASDKVIVVNTGDVTGISFENGLNHIFLNPDFGTNDEVTAVANQTNTAPSGAAIKLGTIDTSSQNEEYVNRRPVVEGRKFYMNHLQVEVEGTYLDDVPQHFGGDEDFSEFYDSSSDTWTLNTGNITPIEVDKSGSVHLTENDVDIGSQAITGDSGWELSFNSTNAVEVSNGGSTPDLRVEDGRAEIDGYVSWHAGNHGPGSGLDADYLDGHDWSEIPKGYVSKDGDTMTGNLVLENANLYTTGLFLDNKETSTAQDVDGHVIYDRSEGLYNYNSGINGWQRYWNDNDFHPDEFVLVAGDTMEGDLHMHENTLSFATRPGQSDLKISQEYDTHSHNLGSAKFEHIESNGYPQYRFSSTNEEDGITKQPLILDPDDNTNHMKDVDLKVEGDIFEGGDRVSTRNWTQSNYLARDGSNNMSANLGMGDNAITDIDGGIHFSSASGTGLDFTKNGDGSHYLMEMSDTNGNTFAMQFNEVNGEMVDFIDEANNRDLLRIGTAGEIEIPEGALDMHVNNIDRANTVNARRVDISGVAGNDSTDNARGLGTPTVFTDAIEAQSEEGGSSTYISLGDGNGKVASDEIGFTTNGSVGPKITGPGHLYMDGNIVKNTNRVDSPNGAISFIDYGGNTRITPGENWDDEITLSSGRPGSNKDIIAIPNGGDIKVRGSMDFIADESQYIRLPYDNGNNANRAIWWDSDSMELRARDPNGGTHTLASY